jgi:predicted nucleic acid-binding protein
MDGSGVVDASLLLSLGEASALHLLWDDPGRIWHVTPIARIEVQRDPTRSELSRAILSGRLATAELDTDSEEELRLFAHWSDLVDAGEAEAIAVALARGWVVGLEDLFAQRCVTREAGEAHWVNAAGLLLTATRGGRMSMADADAVFLRLDCYSGYRKRGIRSLRDLSL